MHYLQHEGPCSMRYTNPDRRGQFNADSNVVNGLSIFPILWIYWRSYFEYTSYIFKALIMPRLGWSDLGVTHGKYFNCSDGPPIFFLEDLVGPPNKI